MSEEHRRKLEWATRMSLDQGLPEAEAEAAAAALFPPLKEIALTRPPRGYVKEVRRQARQFAKEAGRLRKAGRRSEIGALAERTLDTYFDLATRYREPMLRRFSNPERDRAEPLTLMGDLIARPDMSYDEGRTAMARQAVRSSEAIARAGADWPNRDQYGNPALRADVTVWLDPQRGWLPGRLEASLSPGVMTEHPNLMFWVGARGTEDTLFGSQTVFMLLRSDIRSEGMTYEVRWVDALDHYRTRVALLRAAGTELEPLYRYLEQDWAGLEGDEKVGKLISREPSIADPG